MSSFSSSSSSLSSSTERPTSFSTWPLTTPSQQPMPLSLPPPSPPPPGSPQSSTSFSSFTTTSSSSSSSSSSAKSITSNMSQVLARRAHTDFSLYLKYSLRKYFIQNAGKARKSFESFRQMRQNLETGLENEMPGFEEGVDGGDGGVGASPSAAVAGEAKSEAAMGNINGMRRSATVGKGSKPKDWDLKRSSLGRKNWLEEQRRNYGTVSGPCSDLQKNREREGAAMLGERKEELLQRIREIEAERKGVSYAKAVVGRSGTAKRMDIESMREKRVEGRRLSIQGIVGKIEDEGPGKKSSGSEAFQKILARMRGGKSISIQTSRPVPVPVSVAETVKESQADAAAPQADPTQALRPMMGSRIPKPTDTPSRAALRRALTLAELKIVTATEPKTLPLRAPVRHQRASIPDEWRDLEKRTRDHVLVQNSAIPRYKLNPPHRITSRPSQAGPKFKLRSQSRLSSIPLVPVDAAGILRISEEVRCLLARVDREAEEWALAHPSVSEGKSAEDTHSLELGGIWPAAKFDEQRLREDVKRRFRKIDERAAVEARREIAIRKAREDGQKKREEEEREITLRKAREEGQKRMREEEKQRVMREEEGEMMRLKRQRDGERMFVVQPPPETWAAIERGEMLHPNSWGKGKGRMPDDRSNVDVWIKIDEGETPPPSAWVSKDKEPETGRWAPRRRNIQAAPRPLSLRTSPLVFQPVTGKTVESKTADHPVVRRSKSVSFQSLPQPPIFNFNTPPFPTTRIPKPLFSKSLPRRRKSVSFEETAVEITLATHDEARLDMRKKDTPMDDNVDEITSICDYEVNLGDEWETRVDENGHMKMYKCNSVGQEWSVSVPDAVARLEEIGIEMGPNGTIRDV